MRINFSATSMNNLSKWVRLRLVRYHLSMITVFNAADSIAEHLIELNEAVHLKMCNKLTDSVWLQATTSVRTFRV